MPTPSGALAIAVSVFFFWGFVAASNGIFIPFCRSHFSLSQFESQLVGSAFYGAYFVGSLILYSVTSLTGRDPFNRFGYRRMIVVGLLISATGALLILPAANSESFPAILGAFFILALGFSVQQTAAQAFVVGLGPIESGAHRLSLAGSVNSFGTIMGPIILSFVLFGTPSSAAAEVSVRSIDALYLVVGAIFIAVALFFHLSPLPEQRDDTPIAGGWGALKLPQVVLGALSIFLYVGVEVTVDNNFGALLRTPGYLTAEGLGDRDISKYISLYWGSLMIGRWTGAVAAFDLPPRARQLATIIAPFVAFAIVLGANRLYGNDVSNLYGYAACVAIAVAAFFYGGQQPAKTLRTVTFLAALAALLGVSTRGLFSVYCFMATGLFCSVMWPCIFALAITGVGALRGQASSVLIMMILGGAVIPPIQGALGDMIGDMRLSYVVAVICFALLCTLSFPLGRLTAHAAKLGSH